MPLCGGEAERQRAVLPACLFRSSRTTPGAPRTTTCSKPLSGRVTVSVAAAGVKCDEVGGDLVNQCAPLCRPSSAQPVSHAPHASSPPLTLAGRPSPPSRSLPSACGRCEGWAHPCRMEASLNRLVPNGFAHPPAQPTAFLNRCTNCQPTRVTPTRPSARGWRRVACQSCRIHPRGGPRCCSWPVPRPRQGPAARHYTACRRLSQLAMISQLGSELASRGGHGVVALMPLDLLTVYKPPPTT